MIDTQPIYVLFEFFTEFIGTMMVIAFMYRAVSYILEKK